MKIIKRSGQEVDFDASKIYSAISKANFSVPEESARLSEDQINKIVSTVEQ